MCGTEQSREAGDYNADAFSQAGQEGNLWKRPTRIDYDQVRELEGEPIDPYEQKDRELKANYFNDSDRSTVASVRGRRQKLGLSRGGGEMIIGADPFLQKNDVLASIKGLERPNSNFGKVRFESTSKKTSTTSKDLYKICHAINSAIFSKGPDSSYKSQARGGLFKDKEFPPNKASIEGFHGPS